MSRAVMLGAPVRSLLLWSPRVLGILSSVFVAAFALDAADEGVAALLLHAAPAVVVLTALAVSWRWKLVGSAVFVALALLYATFAWERLDWVLPISGPLLATGALFFLSWYYPPATRAKG